MRLAIIFNGQDYSEDLENFLTDNATFSLEEGDSFYIGFYKPISAGYFEVTTNTGSRSVSYSYWAGTWQAIPMVHDRTRQLTRSGFIKWSRNLANETKTTISGTEAYWYKFTLDTWAAVDPLEIEFAGINLVLSSDEMLLEEYPNILDLRADEAQSFIGFHQATTNDIVTHFRNSGKTVYGRNLSKWDLLDVNEVKEAAKFLTLAKIMQWRSDGVDDKFTQKADEYMKKYGDKINLAHLTLDVNDTGTIEASERQSVAPQQMVRL